MPTLYSLRVLCCIITAITIFACNNNGSVVITGGRAYYISPAGNDTNKGTAGEPLRTVQKLNRLPLKPGDTVYLEGGQIFNGTLFLDSVMGSAGNPVLITSYGNNRAVINGGDSNAIALYRCRFIHMLNINCIGAGRKTGNTKDGVVFNNCAGINIKDADISGFQKSGLLIYDCDSVEAAYVQTHDNGFAGIAVSGDYGKHNCSNIHITHCDAVNNPGDPANLDNHSGNGIIAGYCKNVTIEYCTATNNGWDMPRTGNGPVGIWCFEADKVIIQHCISYANKTSKGGGDGGGYDLDGGVTNSIIQYCLSYNNQGSGFGIFQYAGAGKWHDNVIRFNISENDGAVSPAQAGVFIWNSSRDTSQFKKCLFYNNVIYNTKAAAISYDKESEHKDFKFYNNIFVAKGSLIRGIGGNDVFLGNDWWSFPGGFNVAGNTDFIKWVTATRHEHFKSQVAGYNVRPQFKNPGNTNETIPARLLQLDNYQLPAGDSLRNGGINFILFGLNNGGKAFNGNTAPQAGIGACF